MNSHSTDEDINLGTDVETDDDVSMRKPDEAFENDCINNNSNDRDTTLEQQDADEWDDEFDDDADEWGEDTNDWGDDPEFKSLDDNSLPFRPMSEREIQEKHNKHMDFWECGKCDFKNNIWRSICLSCHSPNTEVISALFGQNFASQSYGSTAFSHGSNNLSANSENTLKKQKSKSEPAVPHVIDTCASGTRVGGAARGVARRVPNGANQVKHGPKSGLSRELPKCKQCNAFIVEDLRHWHMSFCAPVPTEIEWNDKWYLPLTMVQMEAIHKIMNESGTKSNDAYEGLLGRITEMGYDKQNLDQMLSFMQWHVPITIRISRDVIVNYLLKDPFYRNLFETGKGRGTQDQLIRKGWETRMFGDSYDKGAACERPKYGCLNVSMKKEGVALAASYGECYFVMKDMTCRWRTTLTDQDSGSASSRIGTLSNCCHVLEVFEDANLGNLIQTANDFYTRRARENGLLFGSESDAKDAKDGNDGIEADREESEKVTKDSKDAKDGADGKKVEKKDVDLRPVAAASGRYYREVQIHGDVRCAEDVAELWVPKTYLEDAGIWQFVTENGIDLKVMD